MAIGATDPRFFQIYTQGTKGTASTYVPSAQRVTGGTAEPVDFKPGFSAVLEKGAINRNNENSAITAIPYVQEFHTVEKPIDVAKVNQEMAIRHTSAQAKNPFAQNYNSQYAATNGYTSSKHIESVPKQDDTHAMSFLGDVINYDNLVGLNGLKKGFIA